MKQYLYLNFRDAKLYWPEYKFHNGSVKKINTENYSHPDIMGTVIRDKIEVDMKEIIPLHCVSGMLHYLCGLTPVPFKDRLGFIKENERIVNAARSARIKLNTYYNPDDECGFHLEIKNTNKAHIYDSNLECKTTFEFETTPPQNYLSGEYTLERLKINIGSVEKYNLIVGFIDSVIGIQGKDHIEIWHELHNIKDSDEFITKRNEFVSQYPEVMDALETNFKKLIFNLGNFVKTSSTYNKKRRPLFNQRGIGYVVSFSGDMIIEIDDDIVSLIEDGPMTATLLDGGLVTITGLKNWCDIPDYDTEWYKIN